MGLKEHMKQAQKNGRTKMFKLFSVKLSKQQLKLNKNYSSKQKRKRFKSALMSKFLPM